MKHRGKHKLINFYINLLNLLNCFDGSIRTSTRKDAHPSGGVGSSNPCRWKGERLHHHGDGRYFTTLYGMIHQKRGGTLRRGYGIKEQEMTM